MKIDTMYIYEDSYIDGKLVRDMNKIDKELFVKRQEAKGRKVIFIDEEDELR